MRFRVSRLVLPVFLIGILPLAFSDAPVLVLAAFSALAVLLQLSQKDIPPPLVIGLLVLWLIASLQLLYFDTFEGQPLGPLHENATLYSLAGVLVLALGIRSVSVLFPGHLAKPMLDLDRDLARLNMDRLFRLFLLAWLLNAGPIVALPLRIPAIGQFLLPLFTIKWAFFFLICLAGLRLPHRQKYLTRAVLIEILGGVGGFWGGFIQFVYFFGVAFLYARPTYPPRYYVGGALLVAFIGLMAVHWTAVKDDYRRYISGGTTEQTVRIGYTDRMVTFFDMMTNVDAKSRSVAMEGFVRRVGYIDPFADVIGYIPYFRPHGNGEILRQSVEHVLMPRFLFPDKPALDDSSMTRRYTGRDVAGTESNTSINIGYFGESYADWGFPGMLIFLFGLGAAYHLMFGFVCSRGANRLIAEAIAVGGLLGTYCTMHSTPKLFGFLITETAVLPLVAIYGGRWLARYLLVPLPRPLPESQMRRPWPVSPPGA